MIKKQNGSCFIMKIIDMRLRPPFQPYLGKGGMFDMESENPFGVKNFYKNFGMKRNPNSRAGDYTNSAT